MVLVKLSKLSWKHNTFVENSLRNSVDEWLSVSTIVWCRLQAMKHFNPKLYSLHASDLQLRKHDKKMHQSAHIKLTLLEDGRVQPSLRCLMFYE